MALEGRRIGSEENNRGDDKGADHERRSACLPYQLLVALALKLLANAIQVCWHTIILGIPIFNRIGVHLRRINRLSSLGLSMGRGWVGELFRNTFDRLLGPLDSRTLGLFARDVGIALLGLSPEERLDSFPSEVCIFAIISSALFPAGMKRTLRPTWSFLGC